jgi:hypothetical protein
VHELGFDALWVHSGYFDIIQQHKALGRGHHGGGDWSAGWDLPRLRTAMGLHYGFTAPTQCVKYMLGSHDQVGGAGGAGGWGLAAGGGWWGEVVVVLPASSWPADMSCWRRATAVVLPLLTRGPAAPAAACQVGCRHGGKWYKDYEMIGGQVRGLPGYQGWGRGRRAGLAGRRAAAGP